MRQALAAVLLCVAATAVHADATRRAVADAIYFNGPVETLDGSFTRAEALAVADGHILAVGSVGQVFRHAGLHTRYVDLRGHALLPGFVDPHTHLFNDAAGEGLTFDEAQSLALSQGITTIGDLFVAPDDLDQISAFAASGALRIRTSLYLVFAGTCGRVIGTWYLAHPPVRDPEAMLRIPGIKIFADGGVCGVPATTFDFIPPRDPPLGNLWFNQATLDAAVAQADAAGYQVAIHALGDRGRDTAIAAIDHVLAGRKNVLRHRIEHDALVRPDQIEPYVRLGIVATALVISPCLDRADPIENHLPDFTHAWFHPLPRLLAAGVAVAWSSDWPGIPLDTLRYYLYSLVTREEVADDGVTICQPRPMFAAGRVTTRQALRLMTSAGAYALHMETAVGSLEPGKLADLIVVSDDPLAVPLESLKDLAIVSTVVGGVAVYCAPGSERLCRRAAQ